MNEYFLSLSASHNLTFAVVIIKLQSTVLTYTPFPEKGATILLPISYPNAD